MGEIEVQRTNLVRGLRRDVRAVAPVIATLLIVATAVVASALIYPWVMTMIRTQGSQAQVSIKIDSVEYVLDADGKPQKLIVTVRNAGSVGVRVTTVYVVASTVKQFKLDLPAEGSMVNPGEAMPFNLANLKAIDGSTFAWTSRTSYVVRVVVDNGFTAEGNYSA